MNLILKFVITAFLIHIIGEVLLIIDERLGSRKRPEYALENEPRHVISNNVAFWQV